MKIAFLSSIYPAHAEKIYRDNPNLKDKSSDEQMEFIRWHALSSFVRWNEMLEKKGFRVNGFNHNLPKIANAWARENDFCPKTNQPILEIGIEKIKKFIPNIIFCFDPHSYLQNGFLKSLINSSPIKPKLIAWYGANCGDEEIFRSYDLTLSNSKHLVNSLRKKDIKSDFLQHSFDPIILDKIIIPEKRINKVAFFGNLDVTTGEFRERTKLLEGISKKTNLIDIYGDHIKPTRKERSKHSLLLSRQRISKSINKIVSNNRIKNWSDEKNLPPTPWSLDKEFCSRIHPPLYGQQMLQKLSSYRIALNYHNRHTGDYACNMRLFEATGLGCALITDHKSDLHEHFETEKEILSYKNKNELVGCIELLINDPNLANKLSVEAQSKTLNEFNTEKQILILLEILNQQLSKN